MPFFTVVTSVSASRQVKSLTLFGLRQEEILNRLKQQSLMALIVDIILLLKRNWNMCLLMVIDVYHNAIVVATGSSSVGLSQLSFCFNGK